MKRRTLALGFGALPLARLAAAQALDGPLRIVVPYPPGGATDKVARIVGDKLQSSLGVPVVVDNRTGAGGRLAAQQLKGSPANQNAILIANPAVMFVAPLVFRDAGYDPEKDFVPLSVVNDYEFGLAVASAVPVRELNHLIAWLRANPEKANFGVPATGSLPHFFALMTGEKAGVKAQVVGYRGSAPLVSDLIGGQVPVAFDTLETQLPHHDAGKLRVLASSGAKRSPWSPGVPTFKESGLDLVATGWNAFFAPATMPADRIEKISQAIQAAMRDPDTQRKFTDGKLTPVVSTRVQSEALLKAYRAQWTPIVRQSGYQP
ncbi:Bug family tripartite tricarboxylate transporter substrate binding protein [Ramlibacter humi]|uniref:ABC transporter substrate-binding protein n=1 Tax=Ramlibacter humi TaxID=2530451 RepID=A0A4Z0BX60_9BURK|nr:Bug family tripartite tricarboxylate transporter substrate binding protein [Ramlibacter humi]TFZ03927.1 ABC transporter substrate-binding protein [Ramlibacter humi]